MNFNHLIHNHKKQEKCATTGQNCYFLPLGNVRSTQGENVYLTMFCRNCEKREDVFLTREEYLIQRKLIHKEIGDV